MDRSTEGKRQAEAARYGAHGAAVAVMFTPLSVGPLRLAGRRASVAVENYCPHEKEICAAVSFREAKQV